VRNTRVHIFVLRVDRVLGALVNVARRSIHAHEPAHLLLVGADAILLDSQHGAVLWPWRRGNNLFMLRRPNNVASDVLAATLSADRFLVLVDSHGVLVIDVPALAPGQSTPGATTLFNLPPGLAPWDEAALVVPLSHRKPIEGVPPPVTLVTLSRADPSPIHPTSLRGEQVLARYDLVPKQKEGDGVDQPHGVTWTFMHGANIPASRSAEVLELGPSGRGAFVQTIVRAEKPHRCVTPFTDPASDIDGLRLGGALYARRCATGEAASRRFRLCAFTLDDVAGRLVVGNRDGTIEVLDFV
jgi:hypothetical protein